MRGSSRTQKRVEEQHTLSPVLLPLCVEFAGVACCTRDDCLLLFDVDDAEYVSSRGTRRLLTSTWSNQLLSLG